MHHAIQDDKKIHITEYDPNGVSLTCADGCCDAELYYTPKTTNQDGHTVPAKFASVLRTDHRDGCAELAKEFDLFEPSLPLKQAVLAGHIIILSLNDHFGLPPQLWRDFGNAVHARHLDTPLNELKNDACYPDGRKGHRSESVKSAQDLKRVINLIHKHGGDAAVRKTHVTWQHEVKSFEEFYIYKKQQQIGLFRDLYKKSLAQNDFMAVTNGNRQMAYGFPMLLPFYPSDNLRNGDVARLQSRAINIESNDGRSGKITLQHQIELAAKIDNDDVKSQFTKRQFILASPRAISSDITSVLQECKSKTGFVRMHWNAKGVHQFMPSNGVQLPKPTVEKQPALI